jgi:hypothetical protein
MREKINHPSENKEQATTAGEKFFLQKAQEFGLETDAETLKATAETDRQYLNQIKELSRENLKRDSQKQRLKLEIQLPRSPKKKSD